MVRAWLRQGGKLEAVSLSGTSDRVHPSLMMGHYNNQLYLQPVEPEGVASRLSTATPTHGTQPLEVITCILMEACSCMYILDVDVLQTLLTGNTASQYGNGVWCQW